MVDLLMVDLPEYILDFADKGLSSLFLFRKSEILCKLVCALIQAIDSDIPVKRS